MDCRGWSLPTGPDILSPVEDRARLANEQCPASKIRVQSPQSKLGIPKVFKALANIVSETELKATLVCLVS